MPPAGRYGSSPRCRSSLSFRRWRAASRLTLLATIVVAHFRGRRLISENLQAEIARYIGLATAGYLYLKLWDWAATSYYSHAPETADALARLNLTTPYTRTFWGIEVLLGAVIPAAILLNARTRRNERALLAFTLGCAICRSFRGGYLLNCDSSD